MNKAVLIIGIIVVIAILIFKFGFTSPKQDLEKRIRPSDSTKPTKLVDNNKIVIVKNLTLDYLKKAIVQFCNSYNQEQFIAMPRLTVFENQYLITFPYDIDFERFFYFINYIKYANELCLKPDYKPEIIAWCSTKNGDSWMTEELLNKNVILFIPEWDKEHDNVYLTTQYNMGFKMGFAIGESHIKLDKPILDFTNPPTELLKLTGNQTIDFD